MAEIEIYKKSPGEFDLGQRRGRRAMRSQVIMFSLMIFLTLTRSQWSWHQMQSYWILEILCDSSNYAVCCSPSRITIILLHAYERKRTWYRSNVYVYRSIACIHSRFNILLQLFGGIKIRKAWGRFNFHRLFIFQTNMLRYFTCFLTESLVSNDTLLLDKFWICHSSSIELSGILHYN